MQTEKLTKETIEYLLKIIKASIENRELQEGELALPEGLLLKDVYELVRQNGLTATVCKVVSKAWDGEEIMKEWAAQSKASAATELVKHMSLAGVLKKAEAQGIKAVVFKGPVVSDCYPAFLDRTSSDTDIFVEKADYHRLEKIFIESGYKVMVEAGKYEEAVLRKVEKKENILKEDGTYFDSIIPKVGVYINSTSKHCIELHTCLWEDYEGRKMDILASFNLTNPDSIIKVKACGLDMWTLSHTEHLIFQMFHIIKHFSLQGVSARYLCDISLFVNKYYSEIDFERFSDAMEKLGYTEFCKVFFSLAIKYLGLNEAVINEPEFATYDQMMTLAYDLFTKGMADGANSQALWQIYGAMTPYFTGEAVAANSGFSKKLKYIFPTPKSLPNKFSYAKRIPVLLPVAWVHRVVLYLFNKFKSSKHASVSAKDKMDATNYRLGMLEAMGLMEDVNDQGI